MPIVITPSGEYVDDQTGLPVDPKMIQQLDPRSTARQGEVMGGTNLEGEMARENIPPNLDMGMDSEMAAADLSDVDKVRMLIDMGLNPQEAMEAIAREKTGSAIAPQEFGRVVDMQGGQQMADPMMQQQQMQQSPQPMGALPMARPTPPMPMQRPFDVSDMSAEQRDMVRRGIDPFAEGMMGR